MQAITEILQIAESVSREKVIGQDIVLDAMETAIAIAARKKYGQDRNIVANIDRKTGEISIFRESLVVEDDYVAPEPVEEDAAESTATADNNETAEEEQVVVIRVSDAKEKDANIKVGETLREPLPPIDLGRVAAQTAKQVIIQKIREAERERQYEEYKGRVGEIINGVVKRVEFGKTIIDLGNGEAVIERFDSIRGETLRINDRVRAYIREVSQQRKGHQVFLSRTAPEFMAKLFAQEVPEIYDGIIEVKSVAREPGSRAKIAVYSEDHSIDPVGSCVGMRGARVQAVSNELMGEKIDIVHWSADLGTFLVKALSPAEISKVVIDEEKNRISAVVAEDQLSLAIGRRGQNVRLASELVGWHIDIMTDEDEANQRIEEFNRVSAIFIEALDVEEIIAHLLVTEGFSTVDEIAECPLEELAAIEGFDEDIAAELQNRAKESLAASQKEFEKKVKKLGISDDLIALEGLTPELVSVLADNGIKTLDDFADLARDEFLEMVPASGLNNNDIDALIMKARAHWFDEDKATS